MSFTINTNIAAMNAHTNAMANNRNIDSALSKLSSGLRINSAADDASGMAIADSLRAQSSGLGQAISNANDAVGIVQTADKAMDEQVKILESIRTKATQAAQDGQTLESRQALQKDITRLVQGLNNVANQTTYNGQSLLTGAFSNKEFQVGAYSNQTIKTSIGATDSSHIGNVRYETSTTAISAGAVTIKFSVGGRTITLESVNLSSGAGSGMGALANVINKNSNLTGVRASYSVETGTAAAVGAGDIISLKINGIKLGTISGVKANDSDGRLLSAINKITDQTGVTGSIDSEGKLRLTTVDGRGMIVSSSSGLALKDAQTYGRLTLVSLDGRDIKTGDSAGKMLFSTNIGGSFNLNDAVKDISDANAKIIGAETFSGSGVTDIGVGVTSLKGAMMVMNIAESAQKMLDNIRGDLGSVQNQLVSTINNISVTQVNVKAAESNIRDVDFAAESANFSKFNILAQAGSYAMSQANATQQNVLKLLQ